jgi:hypothetical protein
LREFTEETENKLGSKVPDEVVMLK